MDDAEGSADAHGDRLALLSYGLRGQHRDALFMDGIDPPRRSNPENPLAPDILAVRGQSISGQDPLLHAVLGDGGDSLPCPG